MNYIIVCAIVVVFVLLLLTVYFMMKSKRQYSLLKFGIVLLLIGTTSAQNVSILDDKPIVLPEIAKGAEKMQVSFGPMLGLPDPAYRDYYQEEMSWEMGIAAFLYGDDGLNFTKNNTTLYYA